MGSDHLGTSLPEGDAGFEPPQFAFWHEYNAGTHLSSSCLSCFPVSCLSNFESSWSKTTLPSSVAEGGQLFGNAMHSVLHPLVGCWRFHPKPCGPPSAADLCMFSGGCSPQHCIVAATPIPQLATPQHAQLEVWVIMTTSGASQARYSCGGRRARCSCWTTGRLNSTPANKSSTRTP